MISDPSSLFDVDPEWSKIRAEIDQVGDGHMWGDRAACSRLSIHGARPEAVIFPSSVASVIETIRVLAAHNVKVVPMGLGAHLGLGERVSTPFVALSLSRMERVLDYQPANMVLTVEAGMSLARVQEITAERGQWLPLDPPFLAQTTVGGVIAANLSGPVRSSQGTVRDFLIGLKVVTSGGVLVKSGGQVVKNVTGYDMPKLYCGSLGTLGIIVQATFKVRPRPEEMRVARLNYRSIRETGEFLQRLMESTLQPLFVDVLSFAPAKNPSYHVVIGFAGFLEELLHQLTELRGWTQQNGSRLQVLDGADALSALDELERFRKGGRALLRLKVSLLPTRVLEFTKRLEREVERAGLKVGTQSHWASGIVHARVQQGGRGRDPLPSLVRNLRTAAMEMDGSLVVEDVDPTVKPHVNVWGPFHETGSLMKRIKEKLDPKNMLSPGRFGPI